MLEGAVNPAPEAVDQAIALIKRQKPLSAARCLPGLRSAATWTDAKALTTAGRLASRLGDRRLARTLHRRCWTLHPQDSVAFLYRSYERIRILGPWDAILEVEAWLGKGGDTMPVRHRADLLCLLGRCRQGFRDFDTALKLYDEALQLVPRRVWTLSEKASALWAADRDEEALALALECLALEPHHPPTLALADAVLRDFGRAAEAESRLLVAAAETESSEPRWMLATTLSAQEKHDEALRWIAAYRECLPLADEAELRASAGLECSVCLAANRIEQAREAAGRAGRGFYAAVAESLASPAARAGSRVQLAVPFVRQHHLTCSPATLAALAGYWNHPADHLKVAEEICYDGTPSHSERQWAMDHRLTGREFTVTTETARELLKRGIPFAFVSTWATGAHLQAAIGYDTRAGILIIRDPTFRHPSEARLPNVFDELAAFGPRGIVILPESEAGRLEGVNLPDAEIYDRWFLLQRALNVHDRASAEGYFRELERSAPGHRLTIMARRSLAGYDGNDQESAEAALTLSDLFPNCDVAAWLSFACNENRRGRLENLALLEERCRRKGADTVFRTKLARLLSDEAVTLPRAVRLLRRQLSRNGTDASALDGLAGCRWIERRFDEALELYRLTACVRDKSEDAAVTYFRACERLGRSREAIGFLRQRVASLGRLSAAPSITLADCLESQLRIGEAWTVLDEALSRHPKDSALLLHTAQCRARFGMVERAETLLAEARDVSAEAEWTARSAAVARLRSDSGTALSLWQKVLTLNPLHLDARREGAQILAEQQGESAALEWLEQAVLDFPWHRGIALLQVRWLRQVGRASAEAALRRMLDRHPSDDWAWRELALELVRQGRHDEARGAADEAVRRAPLFAHSHGVLGRVCMAAGANDEASKHFERAVGLDVNVGCLDQWLCCAADVGERARRLGRFRDELIRQPVCGQTIDEFASCARRHLAPEEIEKILRDAHAARPDIWETSGSLVDYLLSVGRSDEALRQATGCVEKFPHAAGSWRLVARAHAALNHAGEQRAALEEASRLNPAWPLVVRELAELDEREGLADRALERLRLQASQQPLEYVLQGELADFLWRHGHTDEALATIEKAVKTSPGYFWGWQFLAHIAKESSQPERVIAAADELLKSRPDESRSIIVMAEALGRLQRDEEALRQVVAGLQRFPANLVLHNLHAQFLGRLGRIEEALAALQPPAFGAAIPRELKARKASLLIDAARYGEAATCLEQLVKDEPDYDWPHSLLYDLCRLQKDHTRMHSLAARIAQLAPDEAVSHGMLAESLALTGKTEQAMGAARRAFALDPRYTFASSFLVDGYLKKSDFADARQVAGVVSQFQPGAAAALVWARVALKSRDFQRLMEAAHELIANPAAAEQLQVLHQLWPGEFDEGDSATGSTGAVRRPASGEKQPPSVTLANLARQALAENRARNPYAADLWVSTRKPAAVRSTVEEILAMTVPKSMRTLLIDRAVVHAADNGGADQAAALITERPSLFRSNNDIWGNASYVLLKAGRAGPTVDWLADWEQRQPVPAWIHSNLALSLAETSGPMAAASAWKRVVDAGASDVWAHGAAGLALTTALSGRIGESRGILSNLQGLELSSRNRFFVELARLTCVAHEAGARPSPQQLGDGRRHAEALCQIVPGWSQDSGCRRAVEAFRTAVSVAGLSPQFGKAIDRKSRSVRPRGSGPGSPIMFGVIILVINLLRVGCSELFKGSTSPQSAPPRAVPSRMPDPAAPKVKPPGTFRDQALPSADPRVLEPDRSVPREHSR